MKDIGKGIKLVEIQCPVGRAPGNKKLREKNVIPDSIAFSIIISDFCLSSSNGMSYLQNELILQNPLLHYKEHSTKFMLAVEEGGYFYFWKVSNKD